MYLGGKDWFSFRRSWPRSPLSNMGNRIDAGPGLCHGHRFRQPTRWFKRNETNRAIGCLYRFLLEIKVVRMPIRGRAMLPALDHAVGATGHVAQWRTWIWTALTSHLLFRSTIGFDHLARLVDSAARFHHLGPRSTRPTTSRRPVKTPTA